MSKTVRFLIGPPNAGKTAARMTVPSLSGLPGVDLADVQARLSVSEPELDVLARTEKSYVEALKELLDLLVEEDDVLFEHTLVKSKRRPYYVEEIRKRYPDARIVCYYVLPDEEEYVSRYAGDEGDFGTIQNELLRKLACVMQEKRESRARMIYKMFEVPSEEEGFDEVYQLL